MILIIKKRATTPVAVVQLSFLRILLIFEQNRKYFTLKTS